jgi:UDP:flavonoid glycosyltransferase YjiC (YdhE family)
VRILITSFGSLGDLNPYIGLGLALLERGHTPILGVPGYYVPLVEQAGLQARAIRPDIDPAQRGLVRRIMHPLTGAAFLVRDLLMPVVHESYQDLDAAAADVDVIVSHPLTFAAPLVAERRGLPWASSVLAPLGFFSRSDPPLMAVNEQVDAVRRTWPGLYRRLIPLARVATRTWGKPVHRLRRQLGLPPGDDPVHGGQFSPYLVLAMFSSELAAVQPDWPPNTVVTGALSYDAVLGGLPDALSRFLAAGPPPVVFTLGTSAVAAATAARFYETSVAAAGSVGARAVMLVGQHDAHRLDVSGRSDVHVAEWAPHSALFAGAAVVVHQGGAGTLHTALAAGRPMLVVPFAHDQGDNAVRAERLGVARVIFPSAYSVERVAGDLEALLRDGAIARRAASAAERVRAEQGGARAANALEQLGRRRAT